MSNHSLVKAFLHLSDRLRGKQPTVMRQDAEDALMEAFCRLWRRSEVTDQEAGRMLYTTAQHIGIDQQRRQTRHPQVPLPPDLEHRPDDEGYDAKVDERFLAVERIVDEQLTDTQRRIFRMREFEARPFDEIAREMGITETAVRMQLSRTRKKIREAYQKLNEES